MVTINLVAILAAIGGVTIGSLLFALLLLVLVTTWRWWHR
jgi:hypothetical protein